MKIVLGMTYDTDNTFPKDTIEFLTNRDSDTVYIKLGNREVGVNKNELLGSIKLICE